MIQDAPSELERLWSLLSELSAQLSHNRVQTEELHRRAEELKTQAIHTQTGFTLRRFNVDISQEEFESELERLNVSLVGENQGLQQENRQLSVLLKDYEGTLEAVMAKFRAYGYSTQQHHLDLIRHYEDILLSLPPAGGSSCDSPSSTSIDPLHLSLSLSHLASLVRKALRSLQGEDPEDSSSPLLFPTGSTPHDLDSHTDELDTLSSELFSHSRPGRDESEGGYIGRWATSKPHHTPTTSTSSLVSTPPKEGTIPLPNVGEKSLRPVDDALEREIELQALRRENEELRSLLGISGENEGGS